MGYYLENLYRPDPDHPVRQALSARHNFRVITERMNEIVALVEGSIVGIAVDSYNVVIGHHALPFNTEGLYNTVIGYKAGYLNLAGSGNVFIGYKAGYHASNSNMLCIDNSDTAIPLIYGEFDNNILTVFGNFGVGALTFGTSATRTLGIINGVVPSTSPADMVQLYAENVAASSELKVRDEATNVTTLSPHNFELFKPSKNDPFPWSYHSVNSLIGKKVNADISGALRELEQLTGKQFIYYEDVDKISLSEYLERKEKESIANYIAENTTEVAAEKNEAWGEVEVEEQDATKVIGHDIEYKFNEETGEVEKIKKPKYGSKKVLRNKLKHGYRFNEETGKFLKTVKPTEEEAEKAIKREIIIPDWIEERI